MSTHNNFDKTWEKIRALKGEVFTTKLGLDFTYRVLGNWLVINKTDFSITKSNFIKAFNMRPLPDPDKMSEKIQGSYYVHAILKDSRIT